MATCDQDRTLQRLELPAEFEDLEGLLKTDLQTIVRNHELIDALVKPVPRLQFLVESGGAETYAEARRQTVLSGLSWPVSVKISENATNAIFPKERF